MYHTLYIYIVSEWLLLNANTAIFQLYHGENKLIFNAMLMRSALEININYNFSNIIISVFCIKLLFANNLFLWKYVYICIYIYIHRIGGVMVSVQLNYIHLITYTPYTVIYRVRGQQLFCVTGRPTRATIQYKDQTDSCCWRTQPITVLLYFRMLFCQPTWTI
jgi:hypothetical protein